MLRGSALALLLTTLPPWGSADRVPAVPAPIARHPEPSVVFAGDDGPALSRARAALERVFATPVGLQARELLDARVLAGPLVIDLNHHGENFTPYRIPGRELGETIHFDPWSRPLVDTERGREEALPETVLAHELGHAVFKLVSEEAVIQAVENPVRQQMGMPRRRHF